MNYVNHQPIIRAGPYAVMNIQVKANPEDTRARIIDAADVLFRRLGYSKTAVADIAEQLGMSPANVYRFFPSKIAIVQAIAQACLGELKAKIWAVARSRAPADQRLEQLVLEILAYHKENNLVEQKVNDIVMVAMEQSWDAILELNQVQHTAVELILRDGIEAGMFEPVDPSETAAVMMQAFCTFCHPVLIAQAMQSGRDLEAEARAQVRFQLRAITPRK
jgi:AcrR family transcriptional regulator